MLIRNKTKNTIIAEQAALASSLTQRLTGLLGKAGLNTQEALILRPCNSVHTFFMRFTIDVLFLDKNSRVIKAISYLKPFRITPTYFKARYAIELPAGVIKTTSTDSGDYLAIE